jgi:hypothetical protein
MSTAKHADFEALSAFVDGEAPEWADHVAGCPQCRATAAELRALSAKVASAGAPPPAAQREAAIAAALGAATFGDRADAGVTRPLAPAATRHDAQRARFARRRWSPGSWAMPAVAAVVLACVGFAGVILASTRSTDHETVTLAGPARDSKAETAVGAPTAPVGDLGDVPDAATLRARALGVGAASAGASSLARTDSPAPAAVAAADAQSSATNTGGTGAAVSSPTVGGGAGGTANFNATPSASSGVSAAGGSSAVIAPNAVGTRPCEVQARSREPGLGPVTYFATARRGNVPAYVMGFVTGPNVTLLMLAQDGCGELLRAGP